MGILSETAGELPLAYIVLSAAGQAEKVSHGAAAVRQQLDEFMAAQLADFKRLAGGIIFFDQALPKTATGKTRRAEVNEWVKALYQEQQRRKQRLQEEEEEDEAAAGKNGGEAAVAAANGKKMPAVVVLQSMEFGSDEDEDDE